jgi:prepilin-type N-terminal cleavage/methylation domain-containing protein
MAPQSHHTRGFTLIELLIVIVVIAILAAISIVAFRGIQQQAHTAGVVATINQTREALDLYRIQNGHYPGVTAEMAATDSACIGTGYTDDSCGKTTGTGLDCPADINKSTKNSPYLEDALRTFLKAPLRAYVTPPVTMSYMSGNCSVKSEITGPTYSTGCEANVQKDSSGKLRAVILSSVGQCQKGQAYFITYFIVGNDGSCTVADSYDATDIYTSVGVPINNGRICIVTGGDVTYTTAN